MITVVNENKLPKWQVILVHDAITESARFIKDKYNVDFYKTDVKIKVSNTCRRSLYYHNGHIRLNGKSRTWVTYKKKTIGVYSDHIILGLPLSYIVNLIHELTHLIQNIQMRKYSEVETTLNEIEYIRQFHPYLISKLKKI